VNGPQSEKELFERARALPEGERDAFLENECPDPALRERVRRLLAHAEAAGESFLAEVLRGELEQAVPAPSPPERLGDFRILDRIGVGGMGIVYLAEDTTLGRRVALKVLAPHLAHSEHDRARFKHEARIVARLNHPGVVPVYTFGESEGFLYIASELIEGESLQQRLQRMREAESGGPASLDAQDAARIGVAVADALEHAHQAKVIHRDVKPSNILLATDGAPRLTDFGIAKLLNDEAPVTSAGAGTAHYMSPEQAALASVEIDHRTDIFSLGVVLYEALAGRVPFDGATREQVIEALRREEPRPLRALNERVPVDLQTIVMKAIEKAPRDRYQSAAHLGADLRSFLAGQPILARPATPMQRAWRRVYSRRAAIGVLGVGAVGVAAGGVWGLRERDRRPRVRIAGAPADALVLAARYNPSIDKFGEPRRLGAAGATHRLPPGYHRIIARAGDAYAESSRFLRPDAEVEISPTLRPTDAVTSAMARIPSGDETEFPEHAEEPIVRVGRTVALYREQMRDLPAFWIDRTEVSNGQYKQFLEETDHPAPAMWQEGAIEGTPGWERRPIVNISWLDAQAYAEWAGKRLPTYTEWQRAARGADGRLFPWGAEGRDDPEFVRPRANVWRDDTIARQRWNAEGDMRAHYLRQTRDVDDVEGLEDICAGELLHMLGNVEEWTESLGSMPSDAEAVFPNHRLFTGAAWGDAPRIYRHLGGGGIDITEGRIIGRGFRCAKSDLR